VGQKHNWHNESLARGNKLINVKLEVTLDVTHTTKLVRKPTGMLATLLERWPGWQLKFWPTGNLQLVGQPNIKRLKHGSKYGGDETQSELVVQLLQNKVVAEAMSWLI
jgi:hypothetical protein